LKNLFQKNQSQHYWNNSVDKALFLQLLLDVGEPDYTYLADDYINDFYQYDLENYYYSTQTKNAIFTAFAKYLSEKSEHGYNSFGFSLGKIQNRDQIFSESSGNKNIIKKEFLVKDIIYDNKIDFKVANLFGDLMYVDVILHALPLDKEEIKAKHNKIQVERSISLVNDETKIGECGYRYWRKPSEDCLEVFTKVDTDFEQGELYKVEIKVDLQETKLSKDLVIEDYLPSGFEVVQSKFKTESIAVGEASKQTEWNWNYIENKPNVIFAHAKYVRQDTAVYEYYMRPKFTGTFTQPPVTAYFMYVPDIQSHSAFNYIEVK
ncbi:MAG: hypothetical protein GY828_03250, partial [Candidatus Gracilibacteria bacterium]|nr:hypothetical protein [Candidatus Gracilibacteria bacterium]